MAKVRPIEVLMDPSTVVWTFNETLSVLGVSRTTLLHHIQKHDSVLGVPVLRCGKRILLPAAPVREKLLVKGEK